MDATSLSDSGQNRHCEADSPNDTNVRARNGRAERRQRMVTSSIPNLHCGDEQCLLTMIGGILAKKG